MVAGAIAAGFSCVPALRTPPPLPEARIEAARTDAAFEEARALYELRDLDSVRRSATLWKGAIAAAPDPYPGFEGLIRSLLFLAGREPEPDARREAATESVQAGQWCRERFPGSPRCAYWLGAALGVQARERHATALDALGPMEQLLLEARAGAPDVDHGGPERVLALLYTRAPGWPRGPGDPEEGVEMARSALARDPAYPPNRMALAEALEAAGRGDESRNEYRLALGTASDQAAGGSRQAEEWIAEIERALASR